MRLEPKQKSKALRKGSLFSDFLEKWDVNAITFEDYLDDNRDGYHANLYHEFEIVKFLASEYMKRVPRHERELEISAIDLYGAKFSGFIDGRINSRTLVENKLKGQWTAADEQSLLLDDQITGYIATYSQQFDVPVEEIEYEYHVTRKPGLRIKKTETDEQFLERCKADILDRPDHYFIFVDTAYTKRTAEQIEEWWDDTASAAVDMRECRSSETWRKNTGSCKQFGSLCDFFAICSASSDEVQGVIKQDYRERESERSSTDQEG